MVCRMYDPGEISYLRWPKCGLWRIIMIHTASKMPRHVLISIPTLPPTWWGRMQMAPLYAAALPSAADLNPLIRPIYYWRPATT